MRFGFILFILFFSILMGVWIHRDPGYALFVYQNWTIEMPLWLAIGLAVGIAILVLLFLSALRDTERTVQHFSLWWHGRAQQKEERAKLEQQRYRQLLYQAAPQGEKALTHSWSTLPREKRRDPSFVQDYVQLLLKQHALQLAEEVLRQTLKKSWNTALIYLYGLVEGNDLEKQLTQAENWLKQYPEDPVLYLTLGRLCMKNRLWGKAKDYLEKSLRLKSMPEVYAELARLLEIMGRPDESANCYKKGLLNAINETHSSGGSNMSNDTGVQLWRSR